MIRPQLQNKLIYNSSEITLGFPLLSLQLLCTQNHLRFYCNQEFAASTHRHPYHGVDDHEEQFQKCQHLFWVVRMELKEKHKAIRIQNNSQKMADLRNHKYLN